MYSITVDLERKLLFVIAKDLATPDDMERYDRDIRTQVRILRASVQDFDLLLDAREAFTLPQALTSTVQDGLRWLVDNGMRRAAFLVASTLMKMQLDRLANNPAIACFESEEEALAWLAS